MNLDNLAKMCTAKGEPMDIRPDLYTCSPNLAKTMQKYFDSNEDILEN